MKKHLPIIITIAAVIAVAIAVYKMNPVTNAPQSAKSVSKNAMGAADENAFKQPVPQASITVPVTVPQGAALAVTELVLPVNGYVAIKDSSGKIIAVSGLLTPPGTDSLKITAELTAGKTYTAELRGDNGDGSFDQKADPPIAKDGKTVSAKFSVK
jgi:hypothetical protein